MGERTLKMMLPTGKPIDAEKRLWTKRCRTGGLTPHPCPLPVEGRGRRPRPASSTAKTAFTLIELILVMAMLMIVLAVAAPSLSNFFRGRTLDSEARRFVSLTRYGQSRAVAEAAPMDLWIDTKQGAYGLEEEAGYTDFDTKAVDLDLDKDLLIEVQDMPAQANRSAARNQLRGN